MRLRYFLCIGILLGLSTQVAQAEIVGPPMVDGFSSQFNDGQYAAANLLDGVPGVDGVHEVGNDWAAQGGGVHYVDFDFGNAVSFASFDYAQRNNVGIPGADAVSQIDLFYSDTSGVYGAVPDETIALLLPEDLSLYNYPLASIANTQFVRFQITGVGNPGGAEVVFHDDVPLLPPPPPPPILVLPVLSALAPATSIASSFHSASFGVGNLHDGVVADMGIPSNAGLGGQYAGLGGGPHVVVYDMDSTVDFNGIYYAQRRGSNLLVDKVIDIKFWVTDTDPGDPADTVAFQSILDSDTDATLEITNTADNKLTEYDLGMELSGRYVVMQLTGNGGNPGGSELLLRGESGPGSIAGDIDQSGTVNRTDVALFVANYAATTGTFTTGDFDGNGSTDLSDLAILQQNLGETNVVPSPAAVPEPSSLMLLLLALTSVSARRVRQSRS